jgi:hypothetical protein
MLRILHRHDPESSTFFSTSNRAFSPHRRSFSPISFASGSPSSSPETQHSFPPSLGPLQRFVKYPEWRLELVHKARRAGLGDLGKAMEITMFGHPLDSNESLDAERPPKPVKPDRARGRSKLWGGGFDSSDGSSDESSSETEWVGWRADLLSRRTSRQVPSESAVVWESSWDRLSGAFISPGTDHTVPSTTTTQGSEKTLSSYASADSLLKRTITHASPRKRPPTPRRPDSPGEPHTRHRSPLAGHSDYEEDDPVAWQSVLIESPPPLPSRPSSSESISSHTSRLMGSLNPARMPLSMTMTSLPSFSRDSGHNKKGKGKMVQKDRPPASAVYAPRQTARKRSSTVQSPATHSSTWSGESSKHRSRPKTATSTADAPFLQRSDSGQSSSGKDKPKSGGMKLTLSFAQVAAMGTVTAASGRLPSSDSGGEFESPRFARPDDSD